MSYIDTQYNVFSPLAHNVLPLHIDDELTTTTEWTTNTTNTTHTEYGGRPLQNINENT